MSDRTLRLMQRGEVKDEDTEGAAHDHITSQSESQRERPSNLRQRVRAPQTYDPSCGKIKMEDVEEVMSEDDDIFYTNCCQKKSIQLESRSALNSLSLIIVRLLVSLTLPNRLTNEQVLPSKNHPDCLTLRNWPT